MDSYHTAVTATACLLAVAAIVSLVARLSPIIGRPLVRRLFGLRPSHDKAALAQTGAFAAFILGFLTFGIWIFICNRETQATGLLLTEWSIETHLGLLAQALLAGVLLEALLSALAVAMPRIGDPQDGADDQRPTMVRNIF